MNTSDFGLIATKDHPLFSHLKALGSEIIIYSDNGDHLVKVNESKAKFWLDFTLLDQYRKENLIHNLSGLIACDFTFNDGQELHERNENIIASFAAGYPGTTSNIEFYAQDINMATMFIEIFESKLRRKITFTASPGIGFYVARVMSLIANEALFSLEDELATQEDIDNAMKFGVNYPIGPLQWAEDCGHQKIAWLLQALYHKSKDDRYLPCKTLQMSLED